MTLYLFRSQDLHRGFDLEHASFLTPRVRGALLEAVGHYAVQDLTPVILDERYSVEADLTRFAARARRKHKSPLTAETYAREAMVFARYLKQRGQRTLATLAEADLWTYRSARLEGHPSIRLQPSSWNKIAAMLLYLCRPLAPQPQSR